jgi:hypothetical protein
MVLVVTHVLSAAIVIHVILLVLRSVWRSVSPPKGWNLIIVIWGVVLDILMIALAIFLILLLVTTVRSWLI